MKVSLNPVGHIFPLLSLIYDINFISIDLLKLGEESKEREEASKYLSEAKSLSD